MSGTAPEDVRAAYLWDDQVKSAFIGREDYKYDLSTRLLILLFVYRCVREELADYIVALPVKLNIFEQTL